MALPCANIVLPRDNIVLPCANAVLPCDNIVLPCDNAVLPRDNMVLPCDNAVLPRDNMVLPCANAVLPCANIVLPRANIVLPRANVVLPCNNTVLPCANLVLAGLLGTRTAGAWRPLAGRSTPSPPLVRNTPVAIAGRALARPARPNDGYQHAGITRLRRAVRLRSDHRRGRKKGTPAA